MRRNGEFILLKDGKANIYTTDFESIELRLADEFRNDRNAEYLIVQVVGTVEKPNIPIIHSIYKAQS